MEETAEYGHSDGRYFFEFCQLTIITFHFIIETTAVPHRCSHSGKKESQ